MVWRSEGRSGGGVEKLGSESETILGELMEVSTKDDERKANFKQRGVFVEIDVKGFGQASWNPISVCRDADEAIMHSRD